MLFIRHPQFEAQADLIASRVRTSRIVLPAARVDTAIVAHRATDPVARDQADSGKSSARGI